MAVLVVDDEELVRCAVCEFLEMLGYRVLSAANADEALALARDGSDIQAVVTDVNMPGMSGPEMWQRLRTMLAPSCRVLFMSGRAGLSAATSATVLPDNVLAKPFSFESLEARMVEMMAEGTRKAVV